MFKLNRSGRPAVAVAGLAVVAIAALVVPGLASAEEGPSTAPVPTIKIQMKGKKMGFFGPKTVHQGEELRIVNETSPKMVGPHTFTLVTKGSLPKTAKAQRNCFTPKHLCMAISKWHGLNPKTEKVSTDLVEAGPEGWSTMGSLKKPGDSWFTEKKGDSIEQAVTAKAGTTLYFICAVHPDMQGSIKVLPPATS